MNSAYKTILVAVPPPSYKWYLKPVDALRKTAATLALVPGVRLTFLSVYSAVADITGGEVNLLPPEIFEEAVKEHEKRLRADIEEYLKWFSENGISHCIMMERGDDPAGIILKAARNIGADLLLIGAHHEDSILDLLAPNVAKKVAKHAPCDIITVCCQKE